MSRKKSKTPKRQNAKPRSRGVPNPLSAPLFTNRATPVNSQSSFIASQMSQDNSQLVKPGQSLFSDNEEDEHERFNLDSQRPPQAVSVTVSKKRKRGSTVESRKKKRHQPVPKARRTPTPLPGVAPITRKKRPLPEPVQVKEPESEESESEREDSFFEQVAIPNNSKNENTLQTFKKLITTNAMQRNWASLPPTIVTMLDSIFQLFVENSILNIKFRSNKEKQLFRSFIKSELIKPIMKRFKKLKLPQGIKESELDKEQLTEENSRLESNLDANLKQLNVLNLESKTQGLYLKKEKAYLKDFEKNLNTNLKKMETDLKELEDLIGDDELLKEFENGLEQDEREVLVDSLSDDSAESEKQVYDPANDDELQDVLSVLSRHLQSVDQNVEVVKPVAEKLEGLGSLLSLLLD